MVTVVPWTRVCKPHALAPDQAKGRATDWETPEVVSLNKGCPLTGHPRKKCAILCNSVPFSGILVSIKPQ